MILKVKSGPKKNKYEWHKWFAWKPVSIPRGELTFFVWLQTIERRCVVGVKPPRGSVAKRARMVRRFMKNGRLELKHLTLLDAESDSYMFLGFWWVYRVPSSKKMERIDPWPSPPAELLIPMPKEEPNE